jgi:hypothetical protein
LPDQWVMYFDESYTLKYAIQIKFFATNNITEYEGLTTRLRLAKEG